MFGCSLLEVCSFLKGNGTGVDGGEGSGVRNGKEWKKAEVWSDYCMKMNLFSIKMNKKIKPQNL